MSASGPDVIVVGGGLSGVFAALSCAEAAPQARIWLIEQEPDVLPVLRRDRLAPLLTLENYDPTELAEGYLRGAKELLGAFHRWAPADVMTWWEGQGGTLSVTDGGPVMAGGGNAAIVSTLMQALDAANIVVKPSTRVVHADAGKQGKRFWVTLHDDATLECQRLILAAGALSGTKVRGILQNMGHEIRACHATLFGFQTQDERFRGLNGVRVDKAAIRIDGMDVEQVGELTWEPWGLSGQACLQLSAHMAERLHKLKYRFVCRVNWLASATLQPADVQRKQPQRRLANEAAFGLPEPLWRALIHGAGLDPNALWGELSKAQMGQLQHDLCRCRIEVVNRHATSEESAVCGGLQRDELDFRTMESRRVPGLYIIGQSVDVDGLPGGYNRQLEWTLARLAGMAAANPD